MSDPGLFVSNFQPLSADEMRDLTEQVVLFDLFTDPMKVHMKRSAGSDGFDICSAKPRLVGGKPSKNPRYLQVRPDVSKPRDRYLAELGARLYRRIPAKDPVVFPVISVLSGRRNNPPDESEGVKIRPLAVYGPIHYQELPELFMDYVCSVTGKSPSTTGAGSEGALTKGPFNAIFATADLNNALVSMLLTGYGGFSTAAGWIGPDCRVDHDVSLLIPEIWCRLFPEERDPERMIARGELEKVADFEFEGRQVLASRLGYRITERFVHTYFGRVFDNPVAVFNEEILRPETQSLAVFADGVNNIVEAQEAAARQYFEDGSIDSACPPLRALLHIMAYGQYEGRGIDDPAIRGLFTRAALLSSEWYQKRIAIKQEREVALWARHVRALESFLAKPGYVAEAARLGIAERLSAAKLEHERVASAAYASELVGTLGADPVVPPGRDIAIEPAVESGVTGNGQRFAVN
jgi:phosphoenolpyruvate carboxykinase (diphosphate)